MYICPLRVLFMGLCVRVDDERILINFEIHMYKGGAEPCIKWHSNQSQFASSLAALIDKLILALAMALGQYSASMLPCFPEIWRRWATGLALYQYCGYVEYELLVMLHWPSQKVSTQTLFLGKERTTSIPGILSDGLHCLSGCQIKLWFDSIQTYLIALRYSSSYSWLAKIFIQTDKFFVLGHQQQSVNAGFLVLG